MPPDEIRKLSARELNEWVAFERVFGPITIHERIDAAASLICWVIARANGSSASLDKFEVKWDQGPPKAMSVESMIAVMRSVQRRQQELRDQPKQIRRKD